MFEAYPHRYRQRTMLGHSEVSSLREGSAVHRTAWDLPASMQYAWVKIVVGTLLAANFCVPLATVVSNRDLWEEPMAVLAGNMSLTCTLFGIVHALVGVYNMTDSQSVLMCRFMQYNSFAVAIAFKAAQVCAAVDQFVAVVFPLRHYHIMMQARPWLFAATWLTWALQVIFGFVAHILDMDTFSDHIVGQGNNSTFTGCRWETALANVYTIIGELELVLFSLATASLLVYTGVVGYRVKGRLTREARLQRQGDTDSNGDNQTFFNNYRAFKYIVMVLSLTTLTDIVTPILRIWSRWYPQPKLNGLMHQVRLLGFILEGWAYGLLNKKLRAASKKMFCRRSIREGVCMQMQNLQRSQTIPKPSAAGNAVTPDLLSVESAEAEGRF